MPEDALGSLLERILTTLVLIAKKNFLQTSYVSFHISKIQIEVPVSEVKIRLARDREFSVRSGKEYDEKFQNRGKNYSIVLNIQMPEIFEKIGRFKQFRSEIRNYLLEYLSGRIPSKVQPETGPDNFVKSGRIPDRT